MGEKKKQASAYREPLILIAFVILGAIIGMVMGEKASFLYCWFRCFSSQFPVLSLISAIQRALESCWDLHW